MILKKLKEAGIDIGRNVKDKDVPVTLQVDCSKSYCRERRSDDDNTPLKVEISGLTTHAEWRCRHCLWSGSIGSKPMASDDKPNALEQAKPTQLIGSMPDEAYAFLESHGVTRESATVWKMDWDAKSGVIRLPYIENEKVINRLHIRISDGQTKLETHRIVFFGLAQMGINSEPIVICQRELDAIVLMQLCVPNVIAIPNGGNVQAAADDFDREPDRLPYLSAAAEAVKGWMEIKLVLDDTKDGLGLRQDLSRRLGLGRCKAAKLTEGTVSATLSKKGPDFLLEDVNDANPLPIFGLYSVNDFEQELQSYFESGMASGVSTGWPNVDQLYTVVPGQLTVVTGIPNSGKSEWVDALTMNLALQYGWKFCAFSPENGKEAHVTKLVEKRVEQSADPKSNMRMNLDTFRSGAAWVNKHYCFIENQDSTPTLDWLLDRAKDAALRYGIKGLIIDPWNRIEKKLGERQSETDYVAESLPKIIRFCRTYDVHCWLVVHPKQQQKDHKTGKINAPSLYDMAGSAHFVNMCDNGVVIHRSESIDDTTEVLLRKVRFKHVGRRGETNLKYDRNTGRYSPIETEIDFGKLKGKKRQDEQQDEDAIQIYEVD